MNRTPLVLAVSFPLLERIRDFHPLETCAARRTAKWRSKNDRQKIIKIYTLYLTNSVHNAATLLRAKIYSPIICGCLLLHLNSIHSVSSGNFASSRTRLLKYSTNLIAITSHTFFQSTEITHKLLSDSMHWLFNIFLSTNSSFIGVISGKIPNPYFLLFSLCFYYLILIRTNV